MKQIILIISVCFSSLLYSCTDDNLADTPTKESSEGKRNITFAISAGDGNDLDVTTRGKGTVVTDDYAVKFYLFEKNTSGRYELVRIEEITQPLYTIEDLKTEGTYKYTFVATSIANKEALNVMDFSSVNWGGDTGFDVPIPSQDASVNNSVLENCFISFFDDRAKSIPNFGTGTDDFSDAYPETIFINRDLDIFGYGSYIAPGMTFYTPIEVIMERQFGIVEFVYQDSQAGDKLTCSFSSDYYRLYLSQFTLDKTKSEPEIMSSDNNAEIPTDVFTNSGLDLYTTGDYYSASATYKTFYSMLPIFTRTKELGNGENSIQVYMPYTTAEVVGNSVDEKYQANCIRTNFSSASGTKEDHQGITLKVERGGAVIKTYKSSTSFPIYRNGKTIFRTVGDDFLQVNFGPANGTSSDGIQIDGDGWHGEN